MQDYADHYVANLPNFLCEQVTRQFQGNKKAEHWKKNDTLTSKLAFNHGHEHRSLELVNGKPVVPFMRPGRTPLVTEGEFGILLNRVFSGQSNASFSWNRWETWHGKRLAVFDYSVDKQHSTLRLILSNSIRAVIPYRGTIFADSVSGNVWRISDIADEIPAELKTNSISTVIDYGEVSIGTTKYLLPVRATVLMTSNSGTVKNEMDFQNYRKFEADSTITFAPNDDPAPPPQ